MIWLSAHRRKKKQKGETKNEKRRNIAKSFVWVRNFLCVGWWFLVYDVWSGFIQCKVRVYVSLGYTIGTLFLVYFNVDFKVRLKEFAAPIKTNYRDEWLFYNVGFRFICSDNPYKLKWTSLNPQHMLQFVESTTFTNGFPMKMLEEIMKRVRINWISVKISE